MGDYRTELKREQAIRCLYHQISWGELRQQKALLLELSEANFMTQSQQDHLLGLVCLLDSIQDLAVDAVGFDEELVFGEMREEEDKT